MPHSMLRPTTMRLQHQQMITLSQRCAWKAFRGIGATSSDMMLTRSFSTEEPPKEEASSFSIQGVRNRANDFIRRPQTQFYGLVVGGAFGTYVLSRIVLGFTGFFTHLTPTVVAKWGFYTGFGTATALGGAALVALDNVYIRADPVYKYGLSWVQNDGGVQTALGDGIMPGHLRSYRIDAGRFGGTTSLTYEEPRIQMIFDVTASGPPYRTGLVTLEATKKTGFPATLKTTMLKVDYETGDEGEGGSVEGDQTLFLRGTAEDLQRVSSRSGLSLNMLASAVHINKAAAKKE